MPDDKKFEQKASACLKTPTTCLPPLKPQFVLGGCEDGGDVQDSKALL